MAAAACDRAQVPASAAAVPRGEAAVAHGDATVPAGSARLVAGDRNATATPLPDDIVRGLSTDARVLDCPDGVTGGRSAFEPGWVTAHPLDLDGDGRDDWVVEGRHPCLSSDDGADWWVYADDGAGAGARLVAALGRARTVEILPATEGHFADLRLERGDGGPLLLRYEAGAYAPVGAAVD